MTMIYFRQMMVEVVARISNGYAEQGMMIFPGYWPEE